MATNVNEFGRIDTVLAAAVISTGTFDVGYPSGTSQASYQNGLAGAANVMIVNDNDRYSGAQLSVSFGASTITVTNSTGVTLAAGSRVSLMFDQVDGNNAIFLNFPIQLAAITAAGDVVTDFSPGIAGVIEDFTFTVTTPVTTAAKLASLNLEIGTTNVTGGVIALTSANSTPLGKVLKATAITGANVLTRTSVLSVEAASVTAFAEGQGVVTVKIRPTRDNSY
ncbi:hypothetical protein [Bosea lathyri]|uniref:Uncharacterized protein n=1 Tax=Bosea lathyri TaxID=1036778 RepID=A0A1H6BW57_9HYPH|nr:hypothetical protein [Bosea lathyri]SEG64931.1 hypothetical protein SAMN04488115_108138 [Bosea lathyri]